MSTFGSEEKCRDYLERLRWPDGVTCVRCGADRGISRIRARGQFECDACRYQFSVRVGTVFHDSHLPLWKWFLAVYVMGTSRRPVSASRLRETLGVSYKTAWFLCHRIRAALQEDGTDSPGRPDGGAPEADAARADRAVVSTYRNLSDKHLPAYAGEMRFRQAHGNDTGVFREMLLRLLRTPSITYADLTAGA